MTVQIISYKCEKCGWTYPDIKSATICEQDHAKRDKKLLFLSPTEFYEEKCNAKTTR